MMRNQLLQTHIVRNGFAGQSTPREHGRGMWDVAHLSPVLHRPESTGVALHPDESIDMTVTELASTDLESSTTFRADRRDLPAGVAASTSFHLCYVATKFLARN